MSETLITCLALCCGGLVGFLIGIYRGFNAGYRMAYQEMRDKLVEIQLNRTTIKSGEPHDAGN